MTAWGDWRIGDAERDAVTAELSEHYAAGRLTFEEFDARMGAAYRAVTVGELAGITVDLPAAARPYRVPGQAGMVPGQAGMATGHRRRGSRARITGLLALAALIFVSILTASALPHGALLVALLGVFALPLLLVAGLVAALAWIGLRAWRKSMWLEAVPLAAGMPWLGRVVWAARACHAGRAYWRAGARAYRGFGRGYPGPGRRGYARAGGLSGTTR